MGWALVVKVVDMLSKYLKFKSFLSPIINSFYKKIYLELGSDSGYPRDKSQIYSKPVRILVLNPKPVLNPIRVC